MYWPKYAIDLVELWKREVCLRRRLRLTRNGRKRSLSLVRRSLKRHLPLAEALSRVQSYLMIHICTNDVTSVSPAYSLFQITRPHHAFHSTQNWLFARKKERRLLRSHLEDIISSISRFVESYSPLLFPPLEGGLFIEAVKRTPLGKRPFSREGEGHKNNLWRSQEALTRLYDR